MSIETEVEALRKVPLFSGIEVTKLRLLAFISQNMTYETGESLCKQGETGDCAFLILSGSADIQVNTNQGEKTVASVGSNDVVGEIAIICDVPRTATVVATTDMEVLTISKDDFLKLLVEFPEISLNVMRVLAQRLENTTRDLADAKAKLPIT